MGADEEGTLGDYGSLEEVQRALDANQKFQLDVRAMLESIDDKLAKNEMLLAEVTRCKNRKGRRLHWSLQESMYGIQGDRGANCTFECRPRGLSRSVRIL